MKKIKIILTIISLLALIIQVLGFISYQEEPGDTYIIFFIVFMPLLLLLSVFRIIIGTKIKATFIYKFQDIITATLIIAPNFMLLEHKQEMIIGQVFCIAEFLLIFSLMMYLFFHNTSVNEY